MEFYLAFNHGTFEAVCGAVGAGGAWVGAGVVAPKASLAAAWAKGWGIVGVVGWVAGTNPGWGAGTKLGWGAGIKPGLAACVASWMAAWAKGWGIVVNPGWAAGTNPGWGVWGRIKTCPGTALPWG